MHHYWTIRCKPFLVQVGKFKRSRIGYKWSHGGSFKRKQIKGERIWKEKERDRKGPRKTEKERERKGKRESVSSSAMSDSLWPCGLQPARLLCPRDSPDKNSGGVAISSSRGSFQLRDQTQVWSCTAGRFLIIWATREVHGKVLERALNRQWGPCSQFPGASSKVERVLYLHSLGPGNSEGRAWRTWSYTPTLAQGHCLCVWWFKLVSDVGLDVALLALGAPEVYITHFGAW